MKLGSARVTHACVAALAFLFVLTPLLAEDESKTPPPKQPAASEARLERIEAQLQSLEKKFNELQNAAPKTQKSADAAPKPTTAPAAAFEPKWLQSLTWRSIGPAGMGGRIVDFAVVESDPTTYWVATASGGLLKTTNNGVTFAHQFDRESTVSIGSVCVAPSDPNIVWVGTGENNPRNSVSWGDGVYKSTDGGKTWKNMGLKNSFQIGRIAIHRSNPNIVYVGALGRLYGPNTERGLYRTVDGGQSWERILYVDDKTGVIDVQMHPTDPNTLIVATWERQRDGYDSHPGGQMADGYDTYDPIKKWGAGSGLYKTTDGGQTWHKLTKGLPTSKLGRIGLDYFRKDPNVLFAIVDCEKIGMGLPPKSGATVYVDVFGEDGDNGVRLFSVRDNGPSAKAGLMVDDIVQSIDGKVITKADQLIEEIRNHKVGDKVKFKVLRGEKTLEITVTLERRPEQPGEGVGARGVYLGLAGEDAEGGVRVTAVAADGPAAKAGIQNDDIVQFLGDKSIQGFEQMLEEAREHKPGDKLKVKILRDGQTQELELTLAERAQGQGGGGGQRQGQGGGFRRNAQGGVYLGVNGEDADNAVRITNVIENGPAGKAGLKTGDLVTAVGAKTVDRYEELVSEIRTHKAGDKVQLKVRRGQEDKQIEVTLADRPAQVAVAATRPSGGIYGGQIENVQDEQGPNGYEYGGIYKSTDGGESWTRINSLNPRPMYFSLIRVDPGDAKHLYVGGVSMYQSHDSGKTFKADAGRNVHADQHALWIDPRDGRHLLVGCDGGFYASYDRCANWDHLNTMAIGQFYHVAICPKQPYHVAGGLQDNGSWCGPTLSLDGSGAVNEDWMSVGGGDGFVCRVDPNDPDLIYSESQNGAIMRRNVRTGERGFIRPPRPDGAPPYRFNWNTPFILSSHNSRILYAGGNFVFRSLDRGNDLRPISPEITLTKQGSATAIAESPRNGDILYAGTDDGGLWITRDGGKTWSNITQNLGFDHPQWVATIEPSRFADGRAYVTFDGHRADLDEPMPYVTEDFGKTWRCLCANLPGGSTRCLREDIVNPDLLYLGTEFGAWCSLDRGKSWQKLGGSLPTVAVHEFAIHPTAGEIVAATHGRSLWVLDVSALRQLKPDKFAKGPELYQPPAVVRWRSEPAHGGTNRRFNGQNPPRGAQIYYSLPTNAQKVSVKVVDIAGQTLRELPAKNQAGLNRVSWDLRANPRQMGNIAQTQPSTTRPSGEGQGQRTFARGGGGGGGGGGRGFVTAAPVPAGTYRIVLSVDGKELAQTLHVQPDPVVSDAVTADETENASEEEEEEEEMEREQEHQREIREYNDIGSEIGL